jgi:hypothetical protein
VRDLRQARNRPANTAKSAGSALSPPARIDRPPKLPSASTPHDRHHSSSAKPTHTRLRKGHEGDKALEEKLRDPGYPGKVERAILFTVEAWDVNCQQHIHQRFSQRQIAPVIENLQSRIAELESEVKRLRSSSTYTNDR